MELYTAVQGQHRHNGKENGSYGLGYRDRVVPKLRILALLKKIRFCYNIIYNQKGQKGPIVSRINHMSWGSSPF